MSLPHESSANPQNPSASDLDPMVLETMGLDEALPEAEAKTSSGLKRFWQWVLKPFCYLKDWTTKLYAVCREKPFWAIAGAAGTGACFLYVPCVYCGPTLLAVLVIGAIKSKN